MAGSHGVAVLAYDSPQLHTTWYGNVVDSQADGLQCKCYAGLGGCLRWPDMADCARFVAGLMGLVPY